MTESTRQQAPPFTIRRKAGEATASVAPSAKSRPPAGSDRQKRVPIVLEEPHNSAFLQECSRLMVPGASGVLFIMLNSRGTAMDLDAEALKAKLAALKTEHRDLDEVIALLGTRAPVDQLELQRLKKRKLLLKDQIIKIESELLPDIIA